MLEVAQMINLLPEVAAVLIQHGCWASKLQEWFFWFGRELRGCNTTVHEATQTPFLWRWDQRG